METFILLSPVRDSDLFISGMWPGLLRLTQGLVRSRLRFKVGREREKNPERSYIYIHAVRKAVAQQQHILRSLLFAASQLAAARAKTRDIATRNSVRTTLKFLSESLRNRSDGSQLGLENIPTQRSGHQQRARQVNHPLISVSLGHFFFFCPDPKVC